jgi:erythromycin esterase-like protein
MNLRDFVLPATELLAIGEPTHLEPAFATVRNKLLVELAEQGFRSIVLETDRVAALVVDDFVRRGAGSLDAVMSDGFSHGFGELAGNRELIAWMRDHNEGRAEDEQLACYGFDIPTEMVSAPSPRRYLEHARDYLGLDLNLAGPAGDDEAWSRPEAILDPARSIGATAAADQLRVIADDMLTSLYARAPELIAATSRGKWFRARAHLIGGLDLLRYHRQAAEHLERAERTSRMLATRDGLMAQHLLDIRAVEAGRGPTVVLAQNLHLQRNPARWRLADMDLVWSPAGAIVAALVGDRYVFVAGSLGRSEALGLAEPAPDTYEGRLTGGLTEAAAVPPGRTRTDTRPEQGYFPLDRATIGGADAVLHISAGATAQPVRERDLPDRQVPLA